MALESIFLGGSMTEADVRLVVDRENERNVWWDARRYKTEGIFISFRFLISILIKFPTVIRSEFY